MFYSADTSYFYKESIDTLFNFSESSSDLEFSDDPSEDEKSKSRASYARHNPPSLTQDHGSKGTNVGENRRPEDDPVFGKKHRRQEDKRAILEGLENYQVEKAYSTPVDIDNGPPEEKVPEIDYAKKDIEEGLPESVWSLVDEDAKNSEAEIESQVSQAFQEIEDTQKHADSLVASQPVIEVDALSGLEEGYKESVYEPDAFAPDIDEHLDALYENSDASDASNKEQFDRTAGKHRSGGTFQDPKRQDRHTGRHVSVRDSEGNLQYTNKGDKTHNNVYKGESGPATHPSRMQRNKDAQETIDQGIADYYSEAQALNQQDMELSQNDSSVTENSGPQPVDQIQENIDKHNWDIPDHEVRDPRDYSVEDAYSDDSADLDTSSGDKRPPASRQQRSPNDPNEPQIPSWQLTSPPGGRR